MKHLAKTNYIDLREDRNIFSFILHESIFNNTSYSMQ